MHNAYSTRHETAVNETVEIDAAGGTSPGGYDQLLSLLSSDEGEAAELYLLLRSKLVMYFEGRRVSPADDHADEVLHRAAQKIEGGENVDDINRYVYGIARFVRLESYRKRESESLDQLTTSKDGSGGKMPLALRVQATEYEDRTISVMERCLGECLGKLPNDNKDLLLRYYAADERSGTHIEQRRRLAERLRKSTGALQKQICLLRQKVSKCAHDCIRSV